MAKDKIYKHAAKKGGWIFPPSKSTPYECEWGDIYEYLVDNYDLRGKTMLDIGTAEGLKFMKLSPYFLFGIGIDLEEKMIDLANKNMKNVKNVRLHVMDSQKLQFPDDFFDIVTCRHAPFNLKEIQRVLKKGGLFITQQVHERDKQNLKDHFGRGQNYKISSDKALNSVAEKAKKLGFKNIKSTFSNLSYYFNSEKHLVDFLKLTPVIPDYDCKKEQVLTKDFVEKYKTSKGIESNSARYLITMEK